ncbi:MAG: tetratricopeptide repeat protein, partial [Candidatus Methylomirabilales bacterium]
NLEESVRLVHEALALEPDNSAFLDSLGWAYYKLGRLDEALRELLKAVRHGEKDDPTIRDHLGQVYFDKGMLREAIEQWERALSLDSGNEAIRKRLERARGLISRGAS